MGISRDNFHKRRSTGGKKTSIRQKRKFELGRPAANTKIGQKRIHLVRTRGGNRKYRAMRLDYGNYSWGSEAISRKCRILDVVYNASNNELVRTKTLVKNSIVLIDCTPFRQWYEAHYGLALGRKKAKKDAEPSEDDPLNKKKSNHVQRKLDDRKKDNKSKIVSQIEEQFLTGKLYACVSSRPGQSGRCDGYILEGKELEFYTKKLKTKKNK